MSGTFELLFLGTGTSVGVPVIGCECAVCHSDDRRNKRTRSSIFVCCDGWRVLVDSGPDLREQALREGLNCVDAVLYTHAHVDHVVGFDELRAFCWRRDEPLPLHGSEETLAALRQMFPWAFVRGNVYGGYVKPDPQPFAGAIEFGDLRVEPLRVGHGSVVTHGFLFEHTGHPALAYFSDVKEMSPDVIERIRGVDHLVVDALRHDPHPTHMTVDEALAVVEASGARRGWLTHLGHEVEHATLEAGLPDHVRVAYDGLRISLPAEK